MEEMRSVPKTTLYLWVLRVILMGAIAVALCVFLKLLLLSGFIAVVAGIIAIYLPFFLKGYKIIVFKDIIYIEYGIVFRTTRILPLKNIIYVKCLKTPVLKALGLSLCRIKTVKSVLLLPEIFDKDAKLLLECIEEERL